MLVYIKVRPKFKFDTNFHFNNLELLICLN